MLSLKLVLKLVDFFICYKNYVFTDEIYILCQLIKVAENNFSMKILKLGYIFRLILKTVGNFSATSLKFPKICHIMFVFQI